MAIATITNSGQPSTLCHDCNVLQGLVERRSAADEQSLLDEDWSIGVEFTRSGWRLDDVFVQGHSGLSTVKAKHRGPEDGLWLLQCRECQAFWQVFYALNYCLLDISQALVESPDEWVPKHHLPFFYRGDGMHPAIPFLIAAVGLASGFLVSQAFDWSR